VRPAAPEPPAGGVPVDDDRAPPSDVPVAPPGPGRAPDLSLRGLPAGVQQQLAGPPPEATLETRPRRPTVDELRIQIERAEDAVANVKAGRVDPLLYDYLRGAKARLESEARRLADDIPVGGGDAVRGWRRGYLERVRQATGKDTAPDEQPDLRDDAARRRPDVVAAYNEAARLAQVGAERREVAICLDVAPGREPKATLRRGSGNEALDRLALESFEKSAAARPVPSDARAGRACYEVAISAHRVPPLPTFACGFDGTRVSCAWPYKKLTAVSSRLVSVEYPPAPNAAAEQRSLLRRPR
jgi:hypothetical protein